MLFQVKRTFPSSRRIVRGQVIEAKDIANVHQLVRTGYLVPLGNTTDTVETVAAPEAAPEPTPAEVVARPKRKKKATTGDADTAEVGAANPE